MQKSQIFIINRNINRQIIQLSKKLICVFLTLFFLFSTVVPKTQEFKNSFFTVLNCAVNNIIKVNFYEEYLKTITGIMDYVSDISDVSDMVQSVLAKTSSSKTDNNNNNNIPINTSEDNEVIIQNSTNNQIETLKANLSYLIYETTNKLYNICESVKTNTGNQTSNMGILFFILFSILVVRIKDTIAVILNKKYKILNRLA